MIKQRWHGADVVTALQQMYGNGKGMTHCMWPSKFGNTRGDHRTFDPLDLLRFREDAVMFDHYPVADLIKRPTIPH